MLTIFPSVETFTCHGFKRLGIPVAQNEDRIIARRGLYAVIDGATSMLSIEMNGLTPAGYIAEYVAQALAEKTELPDGVGKAHVILSEVNRSFGEHLKSQFPQVHHLSKDGPCAAAALVTISNDGTVYFAGISDTIALEKRNGCWRQLVNDTHAAGDQELLRFGQELLLRKGLRPNRLLEDTEMRARILQSRKKHNIETGVLSGEPEMDKFVEHGQVSLKGLECLALLSDGMTWPAAEEPSRYLEAAQHIETLGLYKYWLELKEFYDADPDFEKRFRFKHMDDASGIMIRFV